MSTGGVGRDGQPGSVETLLLQPFPPGVGVVGGGGVEILRAGALGSAVLARAAGCPVRG